MSKVVLLLLLSMLTLSHCNIWDNVFSQTLADTPIIIQESLNVDFDVADKFIVKVDFNAQLQVLTLFVYIRTLGNMLNIQLVQAQLDLSNLVVSVMRVDGQQCERYNLAPLQNRSITAQASINKERMFLINLFFKFVGKTEKGFFEKQILDIYKFQPLLFSVPTERFQDLKKQLQAQSAKQAEIYQQIQNSIQIFLHVNAKTGSIQAIYTGQKQDKNIPFQTISSVTSKMLCSKEIQTLGAKDITHLLEFIEKKRKQNN